MVLRQNSEALKHASDSILTKETLTGDELADFMTQYPPQQPAETNVSLLYHVRPACMIFVTIMLCCYLLVQLVGNVTCRLCAAQMRHGAKSGHAASPAEYCAID